MDKFQNKYRIPSARLQSWDYGWDGAYYITICTHNRKQYFGDVVNGKMQLSNIGVLADVFWHEIKNHSKNTELGEFIVMPNHVHGILLIVGNDDEYRYGNSIENRDGDENGNENDIRRDKACLVSTGTDTDTNTDMVTKTIGQKRFQNQGKNTVSSIIGSYESAVSKHAHRLGYEFEWQSRFYDHIIRDDESYTRIADYIINNPKNWENDKFYNGNK